MTKIKIMAILALELTILIIVGIVALVSSESSDLVTYIFGDSLTEVGNNNFLQYSLAKSNFPYYGVDYPGGQPTGRFTNGRTIGDIICTILFRKLLFSVSNCFMGIYKQQNK